MKKITRRDFIKTAALGGAALGLGNIVPCHAIISDASSAEIESKAVVSVVKIKNDNVDRFHSPLIDKLPNQRKDNVGRSVYLRVGVDVGTRVVQIHLYGNPLTGFVTHVLPMTSSGPKAFSLLACPPQPGRRGPETQPA